MVSTIQITKIGLILSIVFSFCLFQNKSNGQDIQFSQFYAAPLYLNPAFAGSAHSARGIVHQRLQWPNIEGKYTTSLFSFDFFTAKYNSGFGILATQDYMGSGIIKSSSLGLQYAYELPLTSKLTARAGLEFNAVSRSVDYSRLRFPSQFTDENGFVGGNVNLNERSELFPDLNAGGVIYSPRMWFSIASHHMNRPNQSFLENGKSYLPTKWSFTGGYKIHLKQGDHMAYLGEEKQVSITPTMHYKLQGKSDQLDLGLYGIYDKFILATWYRGLPIKNYKPDWLNNESMVLIAGYMFGSVSVTYGYDFTISKLSQARTGGSHELNITYIYHKKPKTIKPMRKLPCPHFYREH